MANENDNQHSDDESPDGLTVEERAQFAEMEKAGAGDDAAGGAAAEGEADAGAAAAAADAAAGDGDGAAKGADKGAAADADKGGEGDKSAAAKAAAGAEVDAGEDDGEDDDEPEAGAADGKVGADGQPAKRKKGRVSAKKYQDAEARASAAEARAVAAEQTTARFDERMKILSEALTTPRQQAKAEDDDPMPDKEADAFAFMDWQTRQLQKLGKTVEQLQSGTQAERQQQDVATVYERDARQFAAQEPNFAPAYQHLMGVRVRQLALYRFGLDLTEQGVQLTPQQFQAIERDVAEEEQGIIATALKAGQSPAQAVYRMAKATGFQPLTKEQIEERRAAANGAKPAANGAKAADGGDADKGKPAAKVNVADEIKRIKAGSEASVSLSNGGGQSPPPLTPQRIATMSDEEFNELADNISPEEWQMLVEGRA